MGCNQCHLKSNIEKENFNEITTSYIDEFFDRKNQINGVCSTNQINNDSNNNTINYKYTKNKKNSVDYYSNILNQVDFNTENHNNSSNQTSKVYSPIKMHIKDINLTQMSNIEHIEESMNLYEKEILNKINEVRAYPKIAFSYISTLYVVKETVTKDLILKINKSQKISIPNGRMKIHDALSELNSSNGLMPLKQKDELRVEILNVNNQFETDYIKYKINKKIKKFKKKRKIKNRHDCHGRRIGFHVDLSELSPFETVIVQLIDPYYDGVMRKNILNPQFKYCGIYANKSNYGNKKVGISILFCD